MQHPVLLRRLISQKHKIMSAKIFCLAWIAFLPFWAAASYRGTSGVPSDEETRQVSGFHALSNSGSIEVEVRFGNRESVRLEGDGDLLREIETVVEDGTLKIRYRRGVRFDGFRSGKVKAYVTARRLNALSMSGSGSIQVSGPVTGDELAASLSGSGWISVESNVSELNAAISGSGRIAVHGRAERSNVSLSGSGRFQGEKLKSRQASVKISGSGNVYIHADAQLDASISGSGNVHYSGNAVTNVRTAGSGKVRKT